VCRWAATLDPRPLVREAAALANDAKSCGYTGLVTLQGMLEAAGDWESRLLTYAHPTYYGMMVAVFGPQETV
jgi:aromatic ring-opening dioxygenase LigB subunit